jgi:hypothetical protein
MMHRRSERSILGKHPDEVVAAKAAGAPREMVAPGSSIKPRVTAINLCALSILRWFASPA